MNFVKILLLLCSGLLCAVKNSEGTLAQSSNKFDNDEVINTFAKDGGKKENGVTATSEAPLSTSSHKAGHHGRNTLSPRGNLPSKQDSMQTSSVLHVPAGSSIGKETVTVVDSGAGNGNGSHQKAVWITLLICLNVILLLVIALGLRTGYACYRKFYESQRTANPTSPGTVHFSAGGAEPRIFTVMPGHLVLQIPSGMQPPPMEESSSVGTSDTGLTPCGSSSIRSESPPPPYITLYPQLKDN